MSKKKRVNVVYSTNPDYEFEDESQLPSSIPISEPSRNSSMSINFLYIKQL